MIEKCKNICCRAWDKVKPCGTNGLIGSLKVFTSNEKSKNKK
jgi:hypothetical protein